MNEETKNANKGGAEVNMEKPIGHGGPAYPAEFLRPLPATATGAPCRPRLRVLRGGMTWVDRVAIEIMGDCVDALRYSMQPAVKAEELPELASVAYDAAEALLREKRRRRKLRKEARKAARKERERVNAEQGA